MIEGQTSAGAEYILCGTNVKDEQHEVPSHIPPSAESDQLPPECEGEKVLLPSPVENLHVVHEAYPLSPRRASESVHGSGE